MALLDLSLVTTALCNLLRSHIAQSSAWPAVYGPPQVTAQPPDQLAAGTLGVYLYHVTEEPHLKNQPPMGRDLPPVRFTPMGLCLYYQVSALGSGNGEQITVQEQKYIGCAVKAFHDYPLIDDATRVPRPAPQPPLEILKSVGLDGDDNGLRITLQPVAYHEASSFWNAASLVPRLALYYAVSVVLLEPEKPKSVSGRVYQYGIQTFVGGSPRLDASRATMQVTVPGMAPQTIVAQPAEVPVGGQVDFVGSDLAGGDTFLLLQGTGWPEPHRVDAGWGVIATDDAVSATVREDADGRPIAPGVYSARVQVVRRRTLPDGSMREFPVSSNATPFSIAARIDSLAFNAGIGTLNGYGFTQPDPSQPAYPPDAVQVSVGGTILVARPPAPPPNLAPGEFTVDDATTIRFRLPTGLTPGQPVSLRLFVLGAESPPQWFTP